MKSDKGFTLVEMMIVIAIIGIVSAIAIPGFKSINATKVRDAASMIQADFEKARSRAIRENAFVEVTILKEGPDTGYSILGNSIKMPPGIKISQAAFTDGTGSIVNKTGFNGRGYITNPGKLTLLDSRGESVTVDMDNRFGRITISAETPTPIT